MQLNKIPHSNCFNCVYLYCNLVYLFCKNLLLAFVSDGAPWLPSSSQSNPGPPKKPLELGFPRSRDCENDFTDISVVETQSAKANHCENSPLCREDEVSGLAYEYDGRECRLLVDEIENQENPRF